MASGPIPFRVGEASPANTFFAIWMAQAAGLYAEYGLEMADMDVTAEEADDILHYLLRESRSASE